MLYSLILPLYMLTAPLTLDDGHKIDAPLLKLGQVAPSSGFLISIGDIADIQATLTGNGCMIRVAEIKDRFEKEIRQSAQRCSKRLEIFQKSLDESRELNKNLQLKIKEQKSDYDDLLFGSVAVSIALTATSVFFALK